MIISLIDTIFIFIIINYLYFARVVSGLMILIRSDSACMMYVQWDSWKSMHSFTARRNLNLTYCFVSLLPLAEHPCQVWNARTHTHTWIINSTTRSFLVLCCLIQIMNNLFHILKLDHKSYYFWNVH